MATFFKENRVALILAGINTVVGIAIVFYWIFMEVA